MASKKTNLCFFGFSTQGHVLFRGSRSASCLAWLFWELGVTDFFGSWGFLVFFFLGFCWGFNPVYVCLCCFFLFWSFGGSVEQDRRNPIGFKMFGVSNELKKSIKFFLQDLFGIVWKWKTDEDHQSDISETLGIQGSHLFIEIGEEHWWLHVSRLLEFLGCPTSSALG